MRIAAITLTLAAIAYAALLVPLRARAAPTEGRGRAARTSQTTATTINVSPSALDRTR
jgi:hypothetical protein